MTNGLGSYWGKDIENFACYMRSNGLMSFQTQVSCVSKHLLEVSEMKCIYRKLSRVFNGIDKYYNHAQNFWEYLWCCTICGFIEFHLPNRRRCNTVVTNYRLYCRAGIRSYGHDFYVILAQAFVTNFPAPLSFPLCNCNCCLMYYYQL